MSPMETQEYRELKEMVSQLGQKLETILASLRTCQSRCHVDNPPGRWRGLGRALVAMIRF